MEAQGLHSLDETPEGALLTPGPLLRVGHREPIEPAGGGGGVLEGLHQRRVRDQEDGGRFRVTQGHPIPSGPRLPHERLAEGEPHAEVQRMVPPREVVDAQGPSGDEDATPLEGVNEGDQEVEFAVPGVEVRPEGQPERRGEEAETTAAVEAAGLREGTPSPEVGLGEDTEGGGHGVQEVPIDSEAAVGGELGLVPPVDAGGEARGPSPDRRRAHGDGEASPVRGEPLLGRGRLEAERGEGGEPGAREGEASLASRGAGSEDVHGALPGQKSSYRTRSMARRPVTGAPTKER